MATTSSSTTAAMSFQINGDPTGTHLATNATALILTPSTAAPQSATASYVVSGLTPGAVDTLTAKYSAPGPQTATFTFRQIWAVPLP
jgi:hypothetical protein